MLPVFVFMAGYGCSGGWLVSGSVCVSRRWQNAAVPLVLAVFVVGWLRSIRRMQPMAERSPVGWSHSSGRYPAVCIALMPGYPVGWSHSSGRYPAVCIALMPGYRCSGGYPVSGLILHLETAKHGCAARVGCVRRLVCLIAPDVFRLPVLHRWQVTDVPAVIRSPA